MPHQAVSACKNKSAPLPCMLFSAFLLFAVNISSEIDHSSRASHPMAHTHGAPLTTMPATALVISLSFLTPVFNYL
eukprot:1145725-Pelagomonas_calceolata.AAC.7